MNTDDSGIVRSQYSNYLGSTEVSLGNTEKAEKKRDVQVDTVKDNLFSSNPNHFAEQDAESGYDLLDGVINTPSNMDLIDGIVDSEEERSFISATREDVAEHDTVRDSGQRHSVLAALEKKKEIVREREEQRHLFEQDRNRVLDADRLR